MKHIILSTALLLAAISNASAYDTFVFKDTQRPHGRDRGTAAKRADARRCGAPGDYITGDLTAFENCMAARGWSLDHIAASASEPGNSAHFNDALAKPGKKPRGTPALRADASRCDPQHVQDPVSEEFQQCMRGYGWQYYGYTPPSAATASQETWTDPDTGLECRDIGNDTSWCSNF